MLKLFYAPTTATMKVSIALEELNIPHIRIPVNVRKGVQLSDYYKKLVPTAKIPAILDKGEVLFESSAILMHLIEKNRILLTANHKNEALAWFCWDTSELSPKLFQYYRYAPLFTENKTVMEKLFSEVETLVGLLDIQLINKDYIATEFSVADISAFPWLNWLTGNRQELNALLTKFSNVSKWLERMKSRKAVSTVLTLAAEFDWESEISAVELEKLVQA